MSTWGIFVELSRRDNGDKIFVNPHRVRSFGPLKEGCWISNGADVDIEVNEDIAEVVRLFQDATGEPK